MRAGHCGILYLKHDIRYNNRETAHQQNADGGLELHLGQEVEEGGGEHRVGLLQNIVERGGDPHKDGASNHLKEKTDDMSQAELRRSCYSPPWTLGIDESGGPGEQ